MPANICLQKRIWPGLSRHQIVGSLWGDHLLSPPSHCPSVEGRERGGVEVGVEGDEVNTCGTMSRYVYLLLKCGLKINSISMTRVHAACLEYPVYRHVTQSQSFPTGTELLENLCNSSRTDTGPGPQEGLNRHSIDEECRLVLTLSHRQIAVLCKFIGLMSSQLSPLIRLGTEAQTN